MTADVSSDNETLRKQKYFGDTGGVRLIRTQLI